MFLIILLGLIAKLALVCNGCDVGKQDVKDLDFDEVRTSVLTRFLKQAAFYTC
jgi:hypothetical protein